MRWLVELPAPHPNRATRVTVSAGSWKEALAAARDGVEVGAYRCSFEPGGAVYVQHITTGERFALWPLEPIAAAPDAIPRELSWVVDSGSEASAQVPSVPPPPPRSSSAPLLRSAPTIVDGSGWPSSSRIETEAAPVETVEAVEAVEVMETVEAVEVVAATVEPTPPSGDRENLIARVAEVENLRELAAQIIGGSDYGRELLAKAARAADAAQAALVSESPTDLDRHVAALGRVIAKLRGVVLRG
jgi:hypothetical protein